MALLVHKYGGTSVGSLERIEAVAARVALQRAEGHRVVVVVSAMSGETNRLQSLGLDLGGQAVPREMDVLLSSGEQASAALTAIALKGLGVAAQSFLADQLPIRTDSAHTRARIEHIATEALFEALDASVVPVVAGFQGLATDGSITTLGRGGSDTTAVALAAALKADECQIYTDVDGVYTTDPRVVSSARRLPRVTFEEMLEMASLGSKVLHPRSVEFAGKYGVPVRVLSSFEEGPGTLITLEEDGSMEQPLVSGIAFTRDEAKISVRAVPDVPGVASSLLGPVSSCGIEVDMIVQNLANDGGQNDFTFTVKRSDYDRALAVVQEAADALGAGPVVGDPRIVKVSVVGVGMRSHAGVATQMFAALAKESINIQMISTSEIKISVVLDEKYLELAVRTIHDTFGLTGAEGVA
ncbi:MAG: aspartate kinase [Pseudomonadota bacterium]|nr:aspartate kinase [Pseudomonadota bacterium]